MSVVLCSPEFMSSIGTDSCKCSRHRFTSQPCTPFKEHGQLEALCSDALSGAHPARLKSKQHCSLHGAQACAVRAMFWTGCTLSCVV
jgi:hypothetical protein